MTQRIVQVDAFTNVPFRGNPAAVCVVDAPRSEEWMRNVAREMNLSETAFLHRRDGAFDLRWFTPTVEVDLCGHATLASAHVLWEEAHVPRGERIAFDTRSGRLTAERQGDWIELDFPAKPASPCAVPDELLRGLGVEPLYVGRNDFDFIVEVATPDVVRAITPDMRLLREARARGVIVTSRSDDERFDFISRFFAPGAGVDEDPVTGSAHCCLAPYWAPRLGKTEMLAYQASERGGMVRVRVAGDRVLLGGQAVTVLRGDIQA